MRFDAKVAFSPGRAGRSAGKISSYLVKTKLHPLEKRVSLRPCKKRRCEV